MLARSNTISPSTPWMDGQSGAYLKSTSRTLAAKRNSPWSCGDFAR